jgi:hypothetical protein
MIDKLYLSREINSGRLIDFITRFYTFYFTDYKSVIDFFKQFI